MQRTMFGIAGVAMLGLSTIAQAALPPKWQRRAELEKVLIAASEALDEPIDQIARVAEDRYRVLAGTCIVIARIQSLPTIPMMSGPRKFTVRLDRPVCR